MAAVEVTISGVLFDKTARTSRPVVLIGEASLTGLGIGGGPMPPGEQPPGIWGPTDPRPGWGLPDGGNGGNRPPGIWGGGNEPFPGWGLPGGGGNKPPGSWGGSGENFPTPPIVIPPDRLPPNMKPEHPPAPGSPTTTVPGNFPVTPVTPPEYLVVNYPGIGPVYVAPPAQTSPAPTPKK